MREYGPSGIAAHVARHGNGKCDRFTCVVFDVLIYCDRCKEPMEHHCCHHCCLDCGVDSRGRDFSAGDATKGHAARDTRRPVA